MAVEVVVGAQWGDEGKGRTVDFLAQNADMVVRFQGADNAGHTVVTEYSKTVLHFVPSGILHEGVICLAGPGMAINPENLIGELNELEEKGVDTSKFFISKRATTIITPIHQALDGAEDEVRQKGAIGTTKKGVGPSYADRAARDGIQIGSLLDMHYLEERLGPLVTRRNRDLEHFGKPTVSVEGLLEEAEKWRNKLGDRLVDGVQLVRHAYLQDFEILLEGQLASGRDQLLGIYPFVTSSHPTAGGVCVGTGLPPRAIDQVLGVVKAFSTMVGAGPFPCELEGKLAEKLRLAGPEEGHEFGATTGRPRRTGWFDGVQVGYSSWLNGFDKISVTKLDALDGFHELPFCTGYLLDGALIDYVPTTNELTRVRPVYKAFEGWMTDTSQARSWNELPPNAQRYLGAIEDQAQAPLRFVSVGPERNQMFEVRRREI